MASRNAAQSKSQRKKGWNAKNVLHSPFAVGFPEALAGSLDVVCTALEAYFATPPLKRCRDSRRTGRKRDDESASESESDSESSADTNLERGAVGNRADLVGAEEHTENQGTAHETAASSGISERERRAQNADASLRDEKSREQNNDLVRPVVNPAAAMDLNAGERPGAVPKPDAGFVFGLNAVTRALEKDKLELVVVCRDVSPQIVVAHVPLLCYIKLCKLVVVTGSGTELARIAGVKRMLAFGLLRSGALPVDTGRERHDALVRRLATVAVKLDYPWMAAARSGTVPPALPEPVIAPSNRLRS